MKTYNWIKGLAAIFMLACPPVGIAAEPVRIFAAASLQGPLDAIAAEQDAGSTISYGGSGTLARQISFGAPADVVILANETWANWLVDQGHVDTPTRPLMSNRLAVIAPAGTPPLNDLDADSLRHALGDGRLALGQHQSVPAGLYAMAWLTRIGAWDALSPHLAETDNVRAALALVARGEAPLGIVYASDARASDAVSVIWNVPGDQHPPIRYLGLALTPVGDAFLDHLTNRIALFEAAGFVALP